VITVHHLFFVAVLFALTGASRLALAQVPPDIARRHPEDRPGCRRARPVGRCQIATTHSQIDRLMVGYAADTDTTIMER
jgi:hypothetical protein